MGKHYSKEEQERIKELVTDGLKPRDSRTAKQNRSRHQKPATCMELQADTKASIQSLLQEKKALNTKVTYLKSEVRTLQERREDISKIMTTQEEALNKRLTTALTRLKDRSIITFGLGWGASEKRKWRKNNADARELSRLIRGKENGV